MGLEIIRRLMTRKGFTSEKLSEVSGVPKSTIDKIASGATDNPRYKSLRSIVNALGMSVDDFMRLVDDPNLNIAHKQLLEMFHSLNAEGQKHAHLLIRDMMDSGHYRENKPAAEEAPAEEMVENQAAAREGGVTSITRSQDEIDAIEKASQQFFENPEFPNL